MRRCLLLLATLAGCGQEQELRGAESPPTVPNPAPPIGPEHIEESFIEPEQTPMSVLFLIDQSCSMLDDIDTLYHNMPRLVNALTEINGRWKIGITSTGHWLPVGDGELDGILAVVNGTNVITPNLGPELGAQYFAAMNAAVSTEYAERGILATWSLFHTNRNHKNNRGFLEPGRPLHVVTITDEEEQGWISPDELAATFERYEEIHETHVSYSVVAKLPGDNCTDGTTGYRYVEMAALIGGTVRSICEDDWVPVLDALVQYMDQPETKLYLHTRPVPETIEVWTVRDGTTFTFGHADWDYWPTTNSLTFFYAPEPGEVTWVSYDSARY